MSVLREIVNRKINFNSPKGKLVLKKDLTSLINYLDAISPYPWSPKQCSQVKNSTDLEFITRSPEIMEYLINIIFLLLQNEDTINE